MEQGNIRRKYPVTKRIYDQLLDSDNLSVGDFPVGNIGQLPVGQIDEFIRPVIDFHKLWGSCRGMEQDLIEENIPCYCINWDFKACFVFFRIYKISGTIPYIFYGYLVQLIFF